MDCNRENRFPATFYFREFGLGLRFLFCAVPKCALISFFGRLNSLYSVPINTDSVRDAVSIYSFHASSLENFGATLSPCAFLISTSTLLQTSGPSLSSSAARFSSRKGFICRYWDPKFGRVHRLRRSFIGDPCPP